MLKREYLIEYSFEFSLVSSRKVKFYFILYHFPYPSACKHLYRCELSSHMRHVSMGPNGDAGLEFTQSFIEAKAIAQWRGHLPCQS